MEIIDREKENERERDVKPGSKFRFNGGVRERKGGRRKKVLHMMR